MMHLVAYTLITDLVGGNGLWCNFVREVSCVPPYTLEYFFAHKI